MNKKLKMISTALLIIATIFVIAAIICFVIKARTISYVDPATGIIHERFFLLPLGYCLLLAAIILSITSIILSKRNK